MNANWKDGELYLKRLKTADDLTVLMRIMIFLYVNHDRFPKDTIYNVPYEFTQDGIAIAVDIGRAHVSLILSKDTDMFTRSLAHTAGKGTCKRYCYKLSSEGLEKAEALVAACGVRNIDITSVYRQPKEAVGRDSTYAMIHERILTLADDLEAQLKEGKVDGHGVMDTLLEISMKVNHHIEYQERTR